MTALAALWLKDLRVLRNLGRVLRQQSRFKLLFVLAFGLGIMGGLFALFLDGFHFLATLGGASFILTRRLFALAYFSLGIMLILSSLVTTYSTVFRARETTYLLTAPVPLRDLVTHKFIESAALSSWAFFLLIIPFAAAYGRHEKLGVFFAVWTLVYSVPFVILCSGIGTVISLLAVRWLPRRRWFWAAVILAVAGVVALGWLRGRPSAADESRFVLNRLLPGLQLASNPLMPNWWAAEGIMALTRGQTVRGLMLAGVLVSNTLMVGLVIQWVGAATFFNAYQRVREAEAPERRGAELLPGLPRWLRLLPRDVAGLVAKDVRTFLRDPMQWSQALIFFGLLALYFSSFRSFRYHRLPDVWRNLIVFLNIFSVSSVLCSLASRFVYPQLSLEGHGFWILGLSPTRMRRILLTKFGLAATGMVAISAGLMGLATYMLGVGGRLQGTAIILAVAIALAVTALAIGLGAVFLDLKQSNPVAILSGFGGTLNLALSLGFMLAVIVPFGLLWHGQVVGRMPAAAFAPTYWLCLAWLAGLTALTVTVPLALAARSLERREY